jgi:hypothetical protein
LHHQVDDGGSKHHKREFTDVAESIINLMMKAVSTSETSVNFYQTARSNNTADSHLICEWHVPSAYNEISTPQYNPFTHSTFSQSIIQSLPRFEATISETYEFFR